MTPTSEAENKHDPMIIRFPGGLAVESTYRGFSVLTDQPARSGGEGSGPAPFDLFLASIGTCAGFYALQFVRGRGLPTADLKLTLEPLRGDDGKGIRKIRLTVSLPEDFPEKYRRPLERAIDQCAVKRHIIDPPAFETIFLCTPAMPA